MFVAVLESSNIADLRTLDLDMRAVFGALVVTRSRRTREEREIEGLKLAEEIVRTVHGNTFGLTGLSPARVQSLSPLEDDELSAQGVWVWAVVWIQDVTLKETV